MTMGMNASSKRYSEQASDEMAWIPGGTFLMGSDNHCPEEAPDPKDYPDALPEMLCAGSLVFTPPKRVERRDIGQWSKFKFGANWRKPLGGLSDLRGKLDHPVVHVAYCDALAYAQWAVLDLPTEAEFEFTAKCGLEDMEYAWGNKLMPSGVAMANTWQDMFPIKST